MTPPTLEVLHVPDCPNLAPMLERLRQVTDVPVTTREVGTEAEAAALGMAGSPTLLINGVDPFADPGDGEPGVACRLYRDEHGQIVPAPTIDELREAIAVAAGPGAPSAAPPAPPGEVLSTWRSRARPLEPVEEAVHQAVLHGFAFAGRAPVRAVLDQITSAGGRTTREVLEALHEGDAIRLAPDGQVAVAYPFSATPTRHRVRTADGPEVYAMCAIDALGIAAMLDKDTRIDSVDVTTGQPITVLTTAGHSSWDPPGAVVFIGADAGGGPSADCCCDYLNFFTDHAAATAWTREHPHIPGQMLSPAEAEELGARLFGSLLTPDAEESEHPGSVRPRQPFGEGLT